MAKFFRNKCEKCYCYCIFLYIQDKNEVVLKCTHCGNKSIFKQNDSAKIETLISQIEKYLKIVERHFPDLKYLTKYGDYVKPSFHTVHYGIEKKFGLDFFNDLFSFQFY